MDSISIVDVHYHGHSDQNCPIMYSSLYLAISLRQLQRVMSSAHAQFNARSASTHCAIVRWPFSFRRSEYPSIDYRNDLLSLSASS